MLAKIAPLTNDFKGMARYLVRGKSETPDPKRVAWTISQNLPTEDPELAAAYMAATAEASVRTKKAAYHLMIAWHARERPTPEVMQSVARQTLELAGLGEHQALIMGHGDKPHPHLHILLNRVHPETSRAWKTANDYAAFDRIMRLLADIHGCEYTPAHAFNPEMTDDLPKGPNTFATRAAKRGAPTSRPQWSQRATRDIGDVLSEELEQATTPEEVDELLERQGLVLEAKGRGHVIGNADGYAKLSNVRLISSPRMREMLMVNALAPRHRTRDRTVFDVDGIDITRAMVTLGLADRDDVAAAIHERRLTRDLEAAQRRSRSSTSLTPRVENQRGQRSRGVSRGSPQARSGRSRVLQGAAPAAR